MDRAFSPLPCVDGRCFLGRCPRLGWHWAFGPSDLSAKGAPHLSLWATPQVSKQKHAKGLKARPITRADEWGFQPSTVSRVRAPWALLKAGMERAFGSQEF